MALSNEVANDAHVSLLRQAEVKDANATNANAPILFGAAFDLTARAFDSWRWRTPLCIAEPNT
jgi:hypothetical protein